MKLVRRWRAILGFAAWFSLGWFVVAPLLSADKLQIIPPARIDNCIAVLFSPTVKGGTEAEQALALVRVLRDMKRVEWDYSSEGACAHRYPIRIELNGERIFEIEVTTPRPAVTSSASAKKEDHS